MKEKRNLLRTGSPSIGSAIFTLIFTTLINFRLRAQNAEVIGKIIDSKTKEGWNMASPLATAMKLYRDTFGHSVPSYEVKNAALSGTSERLAGLILAYVGHREAHPVWRNIKDPLEHERMQSGIFP